jgi:hypothetical protein
MVMFLALAALAGLMVTQGAGKLAVLLFATSVAAFVALGFQLSCRLRPIVEVSDDQLRLGPLAAFWPRRLDLSDVTAVEPDTGVAARFWETLRVRLASGKVVRVVLEELDRKDRDCVRALLEKAAHS